MAAADNSNSDGGKLSWAMEIKVPEQKIFSDQVFPLALAPADDSQSQAEIFAHIGRGKPLFAFFIVR